MKSVAVSALVVLTAAHGVSLSAQSADRAVVAVAAQAGDVEGVRALLKQGTDVNAAQGDGMTALHWAANQANGRLAGMLLYAGANVKATTRLGGYTPLHLAAQAGAADVIRELAKAGCEASAISLPSTFERRKGGVRVKDGIGPMPAAQRSSPV